MKSTEFLVMATANANKTKNLRVYLGAWSLGVSRVPDKISGKIGRIFALIQAQIDQGRFCNKESEHLLLYKFQPQCLSGEAMYYEIDMLKRPLAKANDTKEELGEPF